MTNSSGAPPAPLNDRLGVRGGVTLGLVAVVGAGLFNSFGPAAATAGPRLVAAVVVAAFVAALGVAALILLDVHHPAVHGVYDQGRDLLGLRWGHLAGWAVLVGTCSAGAAAALTAGSHLWPNLSKPIAVVVVLCVLALSLQGIERSPGLAGWLVGLVIVLVVVFGVVLLASPPVAADAPPPARPGSGSAVGVLHGAGFLFFAFIGYSRVSLPGDDSSAPPAIHRGLWVALVGALALYLLVAVALTDTLGAGWVAAREAPLAEAAEISAWPWLGPILRIVSVVLVSSVALALLDVTSRLLVRMARDRHLPHQLGVIDGPLRLPRRADAVAAALTIVFIVLIDLRLTIAIASFCALVYLVLAHASVWKLEGSPARRIVPVVGIPSSLVLAAMLPWPAVVLSSVVLGGGAFVGWARWTTREGRAHP